MNEFLILVIAVAAFFGIVYAWSSSSLVGHMQVLAFGQILFLLAIGSNLLRGDELWLNLALQDHCKSSFSFAVSYGVILGGLVSFALFTGKRFYLHITHNKRL